MILPKVRDPRFVTVYRGGTLTDSHHQLLAVWAASCVEHVLDRFESVRVGATGGPATEAGNRVGPRILPCHWATVLLPGHPDLNFQAVLPGPCGLGSTAGFP